MTDIAELIRLGRARSDFFISRYGHETFYVPATSQILADLADALEALDRENQALKQMLKAEIT